MITIVERLKIGKKIKRELKIINSKIDSNKFFLFNLLLNNGTQQWNL